MNWNSLTGQQGIAEFFGNCPPASLALNVIDQYAAEVPALLAEPEIDTQDAFDAMASALDTEVGQDWQRLTCGEIVSRLAR